MVVVHIASHDTAEALKSIAERLGLSAEIARLTRFAVVEEQEEPLARYVRKEIIEGRVCGRGVTIVSSAGRRLAASLAVASIGGECDIDVAHIHFYWGPWTGLPYPYVPRRLEPLIVMHPVMGPLPSRETRNAAGRMRDISSADCRLPGGERLGPLRCSVAELARRINEASGGWVRGAPRLEAECGRILVSLDNGDPMPARLCSVDDVAKLLARLGERVRTWEEEYDRIVIRQLLPWSGAIPLYIDGLEGERRRLEPGIGGPLIVDTNLVYHGIHNLVYEGLQVIVPECAMSEILKSHAEAIKRGNRDPRSLAASLAYLSLIEVKGRSNIIPSGPAPCDTGITRIDPMMLSDAMIATADSGAYRLWEAHPVSRLARPVQVVHDPDDLRRIRDYRLLQGPERLVAVSRIYYSLLQLLVALALAASQRILLTSLEVTVEDVNGDAKRVHVPLAPVRRSLGLA